MDEQNKQPEQQPGQQPACEKKLSRTTLTFYIVGLFSVAIALILISYVAQARADRQLDTLTDQLTEQQTVAQGATQKVEDLQKQYDQLTKVVEELRTLIGTDEAQTDIVGAVTQMEEEREVYASLARINAQLLAGNNSDARAEYDTLVSQYGEERLLGNAQEDSSTRISISYSPPQRNRLRRSSRSMAPQKQKNKGK